MPGKYKGSGSGGGNLTAKYILQVADATLPNAQDTGSLGSGVVLNTTTSGVLSIAALVGLTLATGTITNDFSSGKAGGLTVKGGTAASETLTLQSTAHATKGKLKFGAAGNSVYDEVNDRWGFSGNTAPGCAVSVGDESASAGLTANRQLCIGAATESTSASLRLAQSTTIGVNLYYTSSATASNRKFIIDSASAYAIPVYIYARNIFLSPDVAGGTKAVVIGQNTLDTDGTARLILNCTYDGVTSSANVKWNGFSITAGTLTLYTAVNVTNTTGLNHVNIEAGTITSVSAITVDHAATVRIAGPMVGAGSVTITKAYALWIDSGVVRTDGAVTASGGGATATLGTIGGSGPTTAAANKWIPWNADGTAGFLQFWI